MVKTKLQIIEETVAFYSEDTNRRAVVLIENSLGDPGINPRCVYKSGEKNCALGRCADQEALDALYTKNNREPRFNEVMHILKPEYQGHNSDDFWSDLQTLHDMSYHWEFNSLSERGKLYVEKLKEMYS